MTDREEGRNRRAVGIIEGSGTGEEVAEVFRQTLIEICRSESIAPPDFLSFHEEFGYTPSSYASVRSRSPAPTRPELRSELERTRSDLERYYRKCRGRTAGIFRAAINAEPLYQLRVDVREVKCVVLPVDIQGRKIRIIFVRDHLQGFYANKTVEADGQTISATLNYSAENFHSLARFVAETLHRLGVTEQRLLFIYKFHLFGLVLEGMIRDAVDAAGLSGANAFDLVQPDTGMHILLGGLSDYSEGRDIVLVAGNEIGDVLLEALFHYYRLGTKETIYNLNLAFFDTDNKIEVLQTMHGSADDIAGKGLLNPFATLRAAAYALEKWLGVPHAIARMEHALDETVTARRVTRDMGGGATTQQVLQSVLAAWRSTRKRAT